MRKWVIVEAGDAGGDCYTGKARASVRAAGGSFRLTLGWVAPDDGRVLTPMSNAFEGLTASRALIKLYGEWS
jgi:hypothetical protein